MSWLFWDSQTEECQSRCVLQAFSHLHALAYVQSGAKQVGKFHCVTLRAVIPYSLKQVSERETQQVRDTNKCNSTCLDGTYSKNSGTQPLPPAVRHTLHPSSLYIHPRVAEHAAIYTHHQWTGNKAAYCVFETLSKQSGVPLCHCCDTPAVSKDK